MVHTALLVTHIFVGLAGLVLGPLAMRQDTRRFTAGQPGTGPLSGLYRGVVLLVCVSAAGLVIAYRPALWLAPTVLGTALIEGWRRRLDTLISPAIPPARRVATP